MTGSRNAKSVPESTCLWKKARARDRDQFYGGQCLERNAPGPPENRKEEAKRRDIKGAGRDPHKTTEGSENGKHGTSRSAGRDGTKVALAKSALGKTSPGDERLLFRIKPRLEP